MSSSQDRLEINRYVYTQRLKNKKYTTKLKLQQQKNTVTTMHIVFQWIYPPETTATYMAEWSRDRQEHAVVEVTSLGTSLAHENRQEHAIRGKLGNRKIRQPFYWWGR